MSNAQDLDPNITEEQLRLLLKDKMPEGELEVNEAYQNEYFGQGWPKVLTYIKHTKNLKTGSEDMEIHHIEWESYSFDNK